LNSPEHTRGSNNRTTVNLTGKGKRDGNKETGEENKLCEKENLRNQKRRGEKEDDQEQEEIETVCSENKRTGCINPVLLFCRGRSVL